MKTRVAIYGGTNLTTETVRFVRHLTRDLLGFSDVVLLSGGFDCFEQHPERTSVDRAVLAEAEERLPPNQFAKRFETWVPAPALDRHSVKRFKKGITHELIGTAQARRFKLVNAADALITIVGEGNTRSVLELALAVEKPALPVAFTGGDSGRMWKRHRNEFVGSLRLTPELTRHLEDRSQSARQLSRLAWHVASVVHEAAQKRCLVLMPFGPGHDGFYSNVIRRTIVAADFVPHRIDKDDYAGNIPSLFLSSLERARAVVIDLTGWNPNVMYELGQVHARGISPFLLVRHPTIKRTLPDMPFYLRHEGSSLNRITSMVAGVSPVNSTTICVWSQRHMMATIAWVKGQRRPNQRMEPACPTVPCDLLAAARLIRDRGGNCNKRRAGKRRARSKR